MIENLPKAITPQVTHLKDPDMFWDFISLMPMTTHQVKCFVQEIFLEMTSLLVLDRLLFPDRLLVPDLFLEMICLLGADFLLEASSPSSSLFKSKTLMQAMHRYFGPRSLSYSRIVELPTVTDS